MSSNSEVSYGARIGNAEKLVAALQNFNGYTPVKSEYAINAYASQITDIKAQNIVVATKKQTYSLSVENRRQIFQTDDLSINKLLSPINGAVKVIYGRTAKEATDVASIIAKIRGANASKNKTTTPDENSVSQSYQSFNSKAQYFSDLIVYLTNFGNEYTPANGNIIIDKLNNLYNNAIMANNSVMDAYSKFAQTNNTRVNSYYLLSQTAIRIKDSVKTQYGTNSTEYKLIKGLKI